MPVRILLLAALTSFLAPAQSIVSARSGVIHFAEGEVFLAGAPVEYKAGRFPAIGEGSELKTAAGRAEILLTPGMVLRIGPDSAIRMVSGSLIDTRVEFRYGAAIIDISEDPLNTSVRILFHEYELRFPKRGSFRLDSLPREFRVFDGEAEVEMSDKKCTVTSGQRVSLYGGLAPEPVRASLTDGLDEWSMRRSQQLAADNPPPGDLNGNYDPAFTATLDPFYGLSSYSVPVSVYGTSGYSMGYLPPYSAYPYGGFYGMYQPYLIGIYRPFPIGVYRPFPMSPRMPSHPIYLPVARPPALGVARPVSPGTALPHHVTGRGR
jgi:hypothetical protein